jgi:hypothetical protein
VALIIAGLQMRAAGDHVLSRATSHRWAGTIAVAMLAYIGTLAAGVHVPGEWAEPLPALFVPAWLLIVIVPVAGAVLPVGRVARRLMMLVGLAALVVGPSGTMVSRTMLFAAGWFVVVVSIVPRQKLLHVLFAAGLGATTGLIAANEIRTRLLFFDTGELAPHFPWLVTMAVTWEPDVFSVLYIAAMVLFVFASFVRPTIGMTVGLIAVPTMLVMIASSDLLLRYSWRGRLESAPPPTLVVVALAMACLIVAKAQEDRRFSPAVKGTTPPPRTA